jgi:hypothetical protein
MCATGKCCSFGWAQTKDFVGLADTMRVDGDGNDDVTLVLHGSFSRAKKVSAVKPRTLLTFQVYVCAPRHGHKPGALN